MTQNPTINDVQVIPIRGPWRTKSDANLDVLFSFNYTQLQDFFNYDSDELAISTQDIRGLRSYRVSKLSKGSIGGNEWHRIKKELIFITKGKVEWTVKDLEGATKSFIISPKDNGILILPFIFHTYESLEDDSEILVITNTLFDTEDQTTHDTYTIDQFNV